MPRAPFDVVVVGAGVIGLTTGICLAEQGLRVQLRSTLAPSATTSAVASAMVGPSVAAPDDPATAWARTSIEEFTALASVPDAGVTLRRGRLASRGSGPPLPGFQPCSPDELPTGFAAAWWTTLPLVEMEVYLAHLVSRLAEAGGQIAYQEVRSLPDLARQAPLLANCAGLGARELVPDPTVRPVRGQHVIVDNPGLDEFFVEAPFGPAWAAYWPYPGHVVLGGTIADGDDNPEPDPAIADEILQRCLEVEPRLRGARSVATRWVCARAGRRCGWRSRTSMESGASTTTGMAAAGSPCHGAARVRPSRCLRRRGMLPTGSRRRAAFP